MAKEICYTKEQLVEAIKNSQNFVEIANKLGFKKAGQKLRWHIKLMLEELGIKWTSKSYHRKTWTKEELEIAIKNNFSISSVLRELGLIAAGSNFKIFEKYVKEFNLDTSHFTGRLHSKGKSPGSHKFAKTLEEYLIKDSKITNNIRLKKMLISSGLMKEECSKCKILEWQGLKLSLHLDHINGDHFDYRLENLRFLCPNCHSQTETYCKAKSALKSI